MLIFRVTQKLADKIKVAIPIALPRAEDPLADWTANLFVADRNQYIIVTNTASLYSVIFPGRGITSPEAFIDRTYEAMVAQMLKEGHGEVYKERIIPVGGEVFFSKTGDRKVMGSMNDHVHCAKALFRYADAAPQVVATRLNNTPMGALAYRYPCEALIKLADLPQASPKRDNVIPFRRKT
ncbi:MAG TPA: hypothetical protein DCZ97_09805 [Syntrophus sp. (in: bacteria)]|nr:hypothetical protein [Syntrophus sp. (in: bacteria)]